MAQEDHAEDNSCMDFASTDFTVCFRVVFFFFIFFFSYTVHFRYNVIHYLIMTLYTKQ